MEILGAISTTRNLSGEVWECGAFQGNNALLMKRVLDELKDSRNLRIFDTFTGQPFSGPFDHHKQGSMNGTNFEETKNKFIDKTNIYFRSGIMPFTFAGLEDIKLSVSNIDVDNYDSVKDCLEFVYPRTEISGYIFIDDYGCPNCPGARKATNEFLIDKKEKLQGGSPAFIIKQ